MVQHPDGGIVSEILAAEGDLVVAGQPLLRLDGTALRSDLAIVEGQLSELAARAARLTAERDGLPAPDFPAELLAKAAVSTEVAEQVEGQRRLFESRATNMADQRHLLAQRIDQNQAQADGVAAQIAALARQRDLVEEEMGVQVALLDKGLAHTASVLALRREEARLDGQLGALEAEFARIRGQIAEIHSQAIAMESGRREEAAAELREVDPALLELGKRRRALQDRIDRLEIRAPVSGVVLGLQVSTPRSVLRAAEPMLYIIPQDRPLVIAARIAPNHIDELSLGQGVELVFPAFSSRVTPHLKGRLTRLGADAVTDPTSGIRYYQAEVHLAEGEPARLGDRVLVPGMPVEVYIQTGSRTPLAYLIAPFTDYFGRAFRES